MSKERLRRLERLERRQPRGPVWCDPFDAAMALWRDLQAGRGLQGPSESYQRQPLASGDGIGGERNGGGARCVPYTGDSRRGIRALT